LTASTEKLNRVSLRELRRSVCAVRKNGTQPQNGIFETAVTKLKPAWGYSSTFVALGRVVEQIAETGFRVSGGTRYVENACALSLCVDTRYFVNERGVTQQHGHGETHRDGDRGE
jgi:hypothetical protein